MLKIETFDNKSGGNAFFKAVTHPLAAAAAPDLLRRLKEGRCAVYDVEGQVDALAELYDFSGIDLAGSFVQDVSAVGRKVQGCSMISDAGSSRQPPNNSDPAATTIGS